MVEKSGQMAKFLFHQWDKITMQKNMCLVKLEDMPQNALNYWSWKFSSAFLYLKAEVTLI